MWVSVARADETVKKTEPPQPPRVSMDGLYLTIGPVGTLTRIQDNWIGAVGAEISVMSVHEQRTPAAIGIDFGGISYAGRPGGRFWAEAQIGFEKHLPIGVGLSAGVSAEVDPVEPPRWGGQATLWLFAGVIPYVRVGEVEGTGSFVEVGVMIKIPVRFRY
jgi:hypothetical protein